MDTIKGVVKEYRELSGRIVDVKNKMLPALVKYLVVNAGYLHRCTESGISNDLGISRSLVRDLLSTLQRQRVVVQMDFKKIKPYKIAHIGPAINLGLLHFDGYDEFAKILGPKRGPASESPDLHIGTTYTKDGEMMYSYISHGHDAILATLYLRLNAFLMGYDPFKQVLGRVKSLGWVANMLLEDSQFPPELVVDKILDDAHLRLFDRALIYTHQEILEKGEVDNKEIRAIFASNLNKTLEEVRSFTTTPLLTLLQEYGAKKIIQDLEETKPTSHQDKSGKDEKFDLSCLYALLVIIESSCKVAEHFGADPNLIKQIRQDTTILRKYISEATTN